MANDKPKCAAAVALGKLAKGVPKKLSQEERQRRRESAAYARLCRQARLEKLRDWEDLAKQHEAV